MGHFGSQGELRVLSGSLAETLGSAWHKHVIDTLDQTAPRQLLSVHQSKSLLRSSRR